MAAAPQDTRSSLGRVFGKFLGCPGLADSGLPSDHDAASASGKRLFQRPAQHRQLILSADEGFLSTADEIFDRRLYDGLPTANGAETASIAADAQGRSCQ